MSMHIELDHRVKVQWYTLYVWVENSLYVWVKYEFAKFRTIREHCNRYAVLCSVRALRVHA